VRIQSFTVHADPLKLPEATARLSIEATGVALDFGRSDSGTPMLVLTDADQGNIDLRIARSDLGSMIGALARKAAEKQDVEVESTEVDFTSEGPRALRFHATVNACKMIFSVQVIVTGRFEIDESLDARLMDLDCSGKGIIGAGACEMIRPHLAKIEGRTLPLATLPLGNVRLRDLQLHVGDPLQIEAAFGSAGT